jgi:hypothetical protein
MLRVKQVKTNFTGGGSPLPFTLKTKNAKNMKITHSYPFILIGEDSERSGKNYRLNIGKDGFYLWKKMKGNSTRVSLDCVTGEVEISKWKIDVMLKDLGFSPADFHNRLFENKNKKEE